MPARFVHDGAAFLRPLMWATRDALRAFLRDQGADWVDDPSNEALRFDRVRARKALPELAKLGIGPQVLADVAQHLRSAREALEDATDDLAQRVLREASGIVTIAKVWSSAPEDLQRRLIQRVILWIAPADYPPRGAALTEAILRLSQGLPAQLAGCHFLPQQGQTLAFREARRCGAAANGGAVWDGVWRYIGQTPEQDTQIGPLGAAGLLQWQGWRDLGLPRAALISQPSLWAAGQLLRRHCAGGRPKSPLFAQPCGGKSFFLCDYRIERRSLISILCTSATMARRAYLASSGESSWARTKYRFLGHHVPFAADPVPILWRWQQHQRRLDHCQLFRVYHHGRKRARCKPPP